MKTKILVFLAVIVLAGFQSACTSGPVWGELAKQAASDGNIDCDEYEKIAAQVAKSSDEDDQRFLNEAKEVDHEKFGKRLVSFLKAEGVSIKIEDICNPAEKKKFNLNVFIENSGSMDGYVRGATEFESSIYSLLGSMNSEELVENLGLNYINDEIHEFPKSGNEATNDWLRRFIVDLEPESFASRAGNRSSSDLRNVARMAMEKAGSGNVSMLVSDFLLSFGRGSDADASLTRERIAISNDVREQMKKNPDLGILVLQLESNFLGTYFDYKNNPITLDKAKRPFYVWLIGGSGDLKRVIDSGAIEAIKGGVRNQAIFTSSQKAPAIPFRILSQPRVGEFELPEGAKGPITDARPARDEKRNFVFSFAVAVDFKKQLQPLGVFDDVSSYKLSDESYSVSVERIEPNNEKLKEFTHKLIFKTSKFRAGELKMELRSIFPGWIEQSSTDSDADIATNDQAKTQTFGLSDILGALQDAFYPNDRTVFNSLTFRIEK